MTKNTLPALPFTIESTELNEKTTITLEIKPQATTLYGLQMLIADTLDLNPDKITFMHENTDWLKPYGDFRAGKLIKNMQDQRQITVEIVPAKERPTATKSDNPVNPGTTSSAHFSHKHIIPMNVEPAEDEGFKSRGKMKVCSLM